MSRIGRIRRGRRGLTLSAAVCFPGAAALFGKFGMARRFNSMSGRHPLRA